MAVVVQRVLYRVEKVVLSREIREWVSKRHYSQSCPASANYTFSLVDQTGKQVGYCLFGVFTRLQARKKYPGHLELVRLCVDDSAPKNTESYFVGQCLRHLRKLDQSVCGVVSYCDVGCGHTGVVYRASNFRPIGFTRASYHYEKDHVRIHKKGVWERAKRLGISERDQAKIEELTRVEEKPKLIFQYSFQNSDKGVIPLPVSRFLFFQKWTRESAWLYGAFLGDGHISEIIQFCGNRSTVDCVKRLLKIENDHLARGVYHVHFHSKALSDWFFARGIGRKKKVRCKYPDDIPSDLKWHFIRGLIDTDGGFRAVDQGTKFSLGFSSANRTFIEAFVADIGFPANIHESQKKISGKTFTHWQVKWGFFDSVRILENVYSDSDGIRNEDRYNKYLIAKRSRDQREAEFCRVCGEPAKTKDLCFKHFLEQEKKARGTCTVAGCHKAVHEKTRSICMEHLWAEINKNKEWYRNYGVNGRIRERRIQLGLSQLKLGKSLGHKSNGHVSNVENNKCLLSLEQIEKFATALSVSVECLAGIDPSMSKRPQGESGLQYEKDN